MSEKIKQLSEKEKVRKKISVWLGSSNHIAVIHTIKELVGNSVDEVNKGNGSKIKITLHNKKTIEIEDDCKGLPIEGVNENGTENYKLILATLFAGTKYDNGIDNNNYTVGTNGVFLSVLSYSSELVEYEVARPDGNVYYVKYGKGELLEPLKIVGKSDKTYTKIKYTLDDDVFEENYFTYEEISQIANEQAALIKGEIEVADVLNEINKKYRYDEGIDQFLKEKVSSMSPVGNMVKFQKDVPYTVTRENSSEVKNDDIKIEMSFQYTKEFESNTQIEFLNGSNLIHHGTIYDGLINGLRLSINKHLKNNGMYNKSEKQISKDDVVIGLNYVVNFKSYFPIFANQTKFASYVTYYKDVMQMAIEEFMEIYSIENKTEMTAISTKVLNEKRAREKAEKTRVDAVKQLSQKISNSITRPEKFLPCRSKDRNEVELIVIEGDSAMNSVKNSRNSRIQCVIPVKGKSLNVIKSTLNDILKNKEIRDIFQILECGMEYDGKPIKGIKKFNIDDLSVNKIIIFSDEDEDGMHVRSLIIAIFKILAPQIIDNGHLYVLESPLYKIENGKDLHLVYSEKEKNDLLRTLTGKVNVQRFKGLGGLNSSMLSKTAMHPENRRLTQITMEDAIKSTKIMEMFMDKAVDDRKAFIQENGDKYFDFSIYE